VRISEAYFRRLPGAQGTSYAYSVSPIRFHSAPPGHIIENIEPWFSLKSARGAFLPDRILRTSSRTPADDKDASAITHGSVATTWVAGTIFSSTRRRTVRVAMPSPWRLAPWSTWFPHSWLDRGPGVARDCAWLGHDVPPMYFPHLSSCSDDQRCRELSIGASDGQLLDDVDRMALVQIAQTVTRSRGSAYVK
jgi:hypothetical protein